MDSNAGNSSKEVEVADQGPHLHPNLGNSVAGRSLDPSVVTETGFEKPFFKMRQAEWWNFIQELNLEQRGALFTLVLNMHLNELPVSNDKTHLAYMFGCHANKAYPIVQHLIETAGPAMRAQGITKPVSVLSRAHWGEKSASRNPSWGVGVEMAKLRFRGALRHMQTTRERRQWVEDAACGNGRAGVWRTR